MKIAIQLDDWGEIVHSQTYPTKLKAVKALYKLKDEHPGAICRITIDPVSETIDFTKYFEDERLFEDIINDLHKASVYAKRVESAKKLNQHLRATKPDHYKQASDARLANKRINTILDILTKEGIKPPFYFEIYKTPVVDQPFRPESLEGESPVFQSFEEAEIWLKNNPDKKHLLTKKKQ